MLLEMPYNAEYYDVITVRRRCSDVSTSEFSNFMRLCGINYVNQIKFCTIPLDLVHDR